jgi:hypothetical protein
MPFEAPGPAVAEKRARMVALMYPKAGLPFEEIDRYWGDEHARIFTSIAIVKKNLIKYEQVSLSLVCSLYWNISLTCASALSSTLGPMSMLRSSSKVWHRCPISALRRSKPSQLRKSSRSSRTRSISASSSRTRTGSSTARRAASSRASSPTSYGSRGTSDTSFWRTEGLKLEHRATKLRYAR